MKKIILTTSMTCFCLYLFAQNSKLITYSIGLHALVPANYISVANIRPGASLQAEYRITHSISLTGSIGIATYAWWRAVYVDSTLFSIKKITLIQVPILIGARFYFNNKIYASGQVGASFFNQNLGAAFTYAPGVGTRIGKKFDATLRYIGVTKYPKSFSNLDLRFAYNF
jgi:hypothetical protein